MFNPQMTSSQMELLPLVCLCLLSWSGTTSADPPVVVAEGGDVILPCSINANMETGVFDWKKDGQTEVFLYSAGRHYNNGLTGQDQHFKGRVSHFHEELKHGNASIKIRNAKMADSGNYTCVFPNNHPSPTFHVQLVVEPVLKDRTGEHITAAPEPCVTTLHQTKNSALLQCEAHGVPDPEVHWQHSDGNILPAEEPQVTERGGRKYITVKMTVNKTGNFSCVVTQMKLHHRISSEIYVYVHGAASEPSIKIVKTQDGVLLQCVVRGASPKPKVEWKDSSGSILPAEEPQVTERGGSYDIILQAPVTKTDHYRCVVTQEENQHQIYAETYVPLNGAAPEPSVTILHQTDDWAQLQCKAHGVPHLEVKWQDSDGNILAQERQVSGGDRKYITLLTTVTETGNFSCVATQKNISHEISSQIYVHFHKAKPQTDNTGIIIGLVIALVVVVLLLLVLLLGVLFYKKLKRELQRLNQIIEGSSERHSLNKSP